MKGKVYVSSGLGGMSGAQGKAGIITGCISVIAEIDEKPLKKRLAQGWIQEEISDLDKLVARIRSARANREVTAIGYHGNIVSLWERLASESDLLVDLGSDQTSLHNPFNGGYYPVQISFQESQRMMADDPQRFRDLVNESLVRHVTAVNRLVSRGMRFWDYGNSFLLQAGRAGAEVWKSSAGGEFKYPTYIQEFVGDIFSLGFGPFRWICCSGSEQDLATTDEIAADVIRKLRAKKPAEPVDQQLRDNLYWIEKAGENKMVVGSQARILYADAEGRAAIAESINSAIADGRLSGPVVLSRDHHDVSGTDSPWRETSNIEDGSQFTADMAVHNVIGDGFRGATYVALHNGGGCGWGEVINGGFGLVLDGSSDASRRARSMLTWDVNNGVARRSWAGNQNARLAIENSMQADQRLNVTMPEHADRETIEAVWTKVGAQAARIIKQDEKPVDSSASKRGECDDAEDREDDKKRRRSSRGNATN